MSGDNAPKTHPKVRGKPFTVGNPGGPGRPALPECFKARGHELLKLQLCVGFGETEGLPENQRQIVEECDADIRHKAREACLDRIFGKSKQAVEVEIEDPLTPAMRALLALAVSAKPKEDDE